MPDVGEMLWKRGLLFFNQGYERNRIARNRDASLDTIKLGDRHAIRLYLGQTPFGRNLNRSKELVDYYVKAIGLMEMMKVEEDPV